MSNVIQIRKLAAVDMAWLGSRVIIAEYALGVALPFWLGALTLRAGLAASSVWEVLLGMWLLTIAFNYVPLFLYAVSLSKSGRVKSEGGPELAHAQRYGVQQVIILVPLAVVILAIAQESTRRAGRS